MPGTSKSNLFYISLERLQPASAADTHVRAIGRELQRHGWAMTLFAQVGQSVRQVSVAGKFARYVYLMGAAAMQLRHCDLLYIRQHFATLPIVFAARLLGKPVVLELNGLSGDVITTHVWLRLGERFIYWCYQKQFLLATKVIAVTEGLAMRVREVAPTADVTFLPNGADVDLFKPNDRPRPADAPSSDYVVFFGDFARWHDQRVVIDAVSSPEWPSGVKILIIGRNSPKQLLVDNPNLQTMVVCRDWVPQNELVDYITHALAGIVPISAQDGRSKIGVMPLKLMEILACGRPAIVSDLPTQTELVKSNDCGLVFPASDPGALSEAVKLLSGDKALAAAMGARGRDAIVSQYSWSAIGKRTSDLCRAAVSKQRDI